MEDSRREEKVSYNHLVNGTVSGLRKCNTILEQFWGISEGLLEVGSHKFKMRPTSMFGLFTLATLSCIDGSVDMVERCI